MKSNKNKLAFFSFSFVLFSFFVVFNTCFNKLQEVFYDDVLEWVDVCQCVYDEYEDWWLKHQRNLLLFVCIIMHLQEDKRTQCDSDIIMWHHFPVGVVSDCLSFFFFWQWKCLNRAGRQSKDSTSGLLRVCRSCLESMLTPHSPCLFSTRHLRLWPPQSSLDSFCWSAVSPAARTRSPVQSRLHGRKDAQPRSRKSTAQIKWTQIKNKSAGYGKCSGHWGI